MYIKKQLWMGVLVSASDIIIWIFNKTFEYVSYVTLCIFDESSPGILKYCNDLGISEKSSPRHT